MYRVPQMPQITHSISTIRYALLGLFVFLLLAAWGLFGVWSAEAAGGFSADKGQGGVPAVSSAAPSCSPDWQVVPSPNNGIDNELRSLAVISSTNAWAVGYYQYYQTGQTLIEHWNGTSWSVTPSPNQGASANYLYSVVSVSSTNAWAVGYYYNPALAANQTLIEHWNGTAWSIVSSPNQRTGDNELNSVAAASSSDVWAVGSYYYGQTSHRTLIEHWNGTSWSIVPSPNQGAYTNQLSVVAVATSSRVWAVGEYSTGSVWQTLIEQWNGTSWSITPSPNQGSGNNYLYSVVSVSSTNAWAVGYYRNGTTYQTLIEHWNGSTWSIVSSPNQGSSNNYLYSVAAASSTSAWAVGQYYNGTTYQTLIEHWNGSTWSIVSSPNQGTQGRSNNYLYSVAAASSTNVWAVGNYNNYAGVANQTLTEHWNSTSWSIVSSPNQGATTNELNSVAVVSSTDVWAVGYYVNGSVWQTLTEHWDGTSWSTVPSPNPGNSTNVLKSVAAVSSTDVWAVGDYGNDPGVANPALIEHWDGTQWSIVPSPIQGPYGDGLNSVAAISSTNAWAVGDYAYSCSQQQCYYNTLIEHWDGTQWSIVPSPNPAMYDNELYSVAAVSSNDVWAVGYYAGGSYQTLVEHWNGTQWVIVFSPSPGNYSNVLNSVAAVASNDVWAVGYYLNYNGQTGSTTSYTLVEHWDGTQWIIVPSPNPGIYRSGLFSVAAVTSTDVWAVGYYFNTNGPAQSFIEHWDGTQWVIVPNPNSGTGDNVLNSVAAVSSTDVWAVGYYADGSYYQTLVERYNPCP